MTYAANGSDENAITGEGKRKFGTSSVGCLEQRRVI